jgi:hypothetical protein
MMSLKEGTIMRGYRFKQANRIAMRQFKKRYNIDQLFWEWVAKRMETSDVKREIGILRKTRKLCSCWMCGHRRSYVGLTIQELRQIEHGSISVNKIQYKCLYNELKMANKWTLMGSNYIIALLFLYRIKPNLQQMIRYEPSLGFIAKWGSFIYCTLDNV